MAELTPEMEAMKIKPGEIRNPGGNVDGHSTRPISRHIAEFFEKGCNELDIKERFKSKKAKEALTEALFERAIGKGTEGCADSSVAFKLIELVEGKLEDRLDITTKGERIENPMQERLGKLGYKQDAGE